MQELLENFDKRFGKGKAADDGIEEDTKAVTKHGTDHATNKEEKKRPCQEQL